uniref:Heterokaryon incompatibility domain-containing protein n=1 Tax=Bionectria ochroleuca TaxID=29856 RepID=A0A8H7NDY2_BIOOC
MRLINAHTLALEEFFGASIPKYAILSHTWGSEEILLTDWTEIEASSKELGVELVPAKAGYAKIKHALNQAIRDGLDYLWVDTNCIDKPNWSELAEAINSMFAWYRDAVVCYTYLEDINEFSIPPTKQELQSCRWFTRGWTLQELLAPDKVNFYSGDWTFLGSKNDLADTIKDITGIPKSFITGRHSIYKASLAQRMSWVARRITTRPEDIAYCMLGILDVNMPLIYGEGYKAFIRLQEEIIKSSADESLFCWTFDNTVPMDWVSVLAPSPIVFRDSSNFEPYRLFRGRVSSYSVTNQGLSINLPLIEVKDGFLGLLNVLSLTRGAGAVAIFLQGDLTSGILTRARSPGAPIRLLGVWPFYPAI